MQARTVNKKRRRSFVISTSMTMQLSRQRHAYIIDTASDKSFDGNGLFQVQPIFGGENNADSAWHGSRDVHPMIACQVDDHPAQHRAGAVAERKRHRKTRHGAGASFGRRSFHGERENSR